MDTKGGFTEPLARTPTIGRTRARCLKTMSETKHKHVWDYPNCPDCGSDIFVSASKGDTNKYICNVCNVEFEKGDDNKEPITPEDITAASKARGERATKAKEQRKMQYNWKLEHTQLLGKLQSLDVDYFKAGTLANKYEYTRREMSWKFAALHERDLIAMWGAKGNRTTWYLTDKGKEANPQELVE